MLRRAPTFLASSRPCRCSSIASSYRSRVPRTFPMLLYARSAAAGRSFSSASARPCRVSASDCSEATALQGVQAARDQGLRQHLRQPERLGDLERTLRVVLGAVHVASEEAGARDLGGERGEGLVGLLALEHRERRLHPCQALVEAARSPLGLAEAGRDPGGAATVPLGLEELDRLGVEALRSLALAGEPGHLAGALVQAGTDERVGRELGRLLEVPLAPPPPRRARRHALRRARASPVRGRSAPRRRRRSGPRGTRRRSGTQRPRRSRARLRPTSARGAGPLPGGAPCGRRARACRTRRA